MDISQETNVEKLKALAYDNIKDLERAQMNVQAIETRLQQLANQPVEESEVE